MKLLFEIFLLFFIVAADLKPQGVGVGERFDLTTKLNLGSGQFAQLFIPDYFIPPADGKFILIFHLHSASWAAEDEVYKAHANAILFNIHLGALSSPYQNYFTDPAKFSIILDTALSVISSNEIISNPQIKYLIFTSFSAGYAGLREILKTGSYYNMINSINLADGLHCNSDMATATIQMQDFLRFAKDARDKKKIMLLTHSSITTSGYQSTTQTSNYLINNTGVSVTPVSEIDEIGTMYAKCDTGYFHIRRYFGETADDHLKHLYAMHLMIETAVSILDSTSTGFIEEESIPGNFFLFQNYPNPFNPSTKIKYSIPSVIASETKQSQFVTLKVYDVLGREVVTLVNEEKQPGVYEVEFDASQLSSGISAKGGYASGVYFYKLQTENLPDSKADYSSTKKMIYLK